MAGACRAFPRAEKWNKDVAGWCARNRHKAMCCGCENSSGALPEESLCQEEKREKRDGVKEV